MEEAKVNVASIKAVREQTGCDLKTAKDAVEATATVDEAVALVRSNQPKKFARLSVEAAQSAGYSVKGDYDIVAALSTLTEVYQFIGDHLAEGK